MENKTTIKNLSLQDFIAEKKGKYIHFENKTGEIFACEGCGSTLFFWKKGECLICGLCDRRLKPCLEN